MGVGSHPPISLRGQLLQARNESAVLVKELLGMIAAQPRLQLLKAARLAVPYGDGDLVGTPAALRGFAVHLGRTGPSLWGAEDDHGPAGTLHTAAAAGVLLDTLDLTHRPVHGGGHLLVHLLGIVPLHKAGFPAAAFEEHLGLLPGETGEYAGIGDLEAVEVENGQHGTVGDGIQKLVGVPGGGQRTGLCLTVAHHAGSDEVGVVHDRTEGVGQRVAQFASVIDGAGGLGGGGTGDAAGERELLEELLHSLRILADVGIDLTVRAVQVVLSDNSIAAMTGSGDIDHIEIILDNGSIEMGIDKVLPRTGAPVAHNGVLQVLGTQGLPEQGVVQ